MPHPEYRILEKIASGSFGVVFRVQRFSDGAIMVMKRIPLQDLDPDQRHEAAQELFVMGDLHHPFIVSQRDAFLFNGNDLCLIMDLYDGGDVELLISRQRDQDEYFPLEQVMLWFAEMTLAIDYLHANGILHRDIKSRNLFVNKRTNAIAVGDFGIAERIDLGKVVANTFKQHAMGLPRKHSSSTVSAILPSSQTPSGGGQHAPDTDPPPHLRNGVLGSMSIPNPDGHSPVTTDDGALLPPPPLAAMKGTPLYMSPEALQGAPVGPTSDVWSLGCILYELLCLRHPFETRDIGALVMHVTRGEREALPPHHPPRLVALVDSMLTLSPEGRPSCATILFDPFVNVFVRLLLERRVCQDPDSLAEQSLNQQAAVYVLPLASQRMELAEIVASQRPPPTSPSVERDAVEKRRAAAARAALVMTACGSSGSSSVGGGAPFGNVTAGTFFVDEMRSPVRTGGVDTATTVTRTCNQKPPLGGHGYDPLDSLLPYMIYDETPGSEPDPSSSPVLLPHPSPPVHHRGPLVRAPLRSAPQSCSEDSFFQRYHNVQDMRYALLPALAQEVVRMRAFVQEAMREAQRRKSALALAPVHGGCVAAAMPTTISGVPTHGQGVAGSSPEVSFPHDHPSQPPAVAMVRAQKIPGLQVYLRQRQKLVTIALGHLSPPVFAAVYQYYKHTSVLQRDPGVVRRWVPDPSVWPILPTVGDIVVLDKLLDGGSGSPSL